MVVAQEKPDYSPEKKRQATRKNKVLYLPGRERWVLTGLVLLIFGLGMLTLYVYAQMAIACYQINKLTQDIEYLAIETQALSEELCCLSSLERVEIVATNKLGMVRPDTKNMILVKVSPEKDNLPVNLKASKQNSNGKKQNWIIQALVNLVYSREKEKPG